MSSLQALSNPEEKIKLGQTQNAPALTQEQVQSAVQALSDHSAVKNYPEVERRFIDPSIDKQKYGLFTFVPAKGATPNEKGIYGFAKLRGNFETQAEADERAEDIIRNVDSYHRIYHTLVGRPFPVTNTGDLAQDVNAVQLQQAYSADVKKQREKEQKEIEEIKQREKELLDDVKKTEEDIDDRYTTLHVKRAQLCWTYIETKKKLEQMTGLIARARREIEEIDREHPELRGQYYNKYCEARKQAGLPVTGNPNTDESFMKYLVQDAVIPEADAEYEKIYGVEKNM